MPVIHCMKAKSINLKVHLKKNPLSRIHSSVDVSLEKQTLTPGN